MKHAIALLTIAFCLYCAWQVAPLDVRATVKALARKHATGVTAILVVCAISVVLAYYLTAAKVL